MADFAGLLKKTIEAQSNVTPQLRQRVYARARETIDKKLSESNIPESIALQQKNLLEKAINDVEAFYQTAEKASFEAIVKPEEHTALEKKNTVQPTISETKAPELPPSHHSKPVETAFEQSEKTSEPLLYKEESERPKETSHHLTQSSDVKDVPEAEPVANIGKTLPQRALTAETPREPATIKPVINEPPLKQTKKSIKENKKQKKHSFDRLGHILKTQSQRKALAAEKKKLWVFSSLAGLLILLIVGATLWILDPFAKKIEIIADQPTNDNLVPQTEKMMQRLLPDGSEITPEPSVSHAESSYPKSNAEATSSSTRIDLAKATLYQTQTPTQTEKIQTGDVEWVEARDISDSGRDLGPLIRGDVSIPIDTAGDKFMMIMTIRPNRDETIPATYITDIIFVTPDSFKEGPVDEILDLTFKATEQLPGQQMIGTTQTRIADNFFIFSMSSSGPYATTNLRVMRQMPWIRVVARFKSGRIMELVFNKGDKGKEIFDQVISEWLGERSSTNLN